MAVQISGNDITVPRDTTVTRNLTVGGVLTYEDVTNVDSIGIVTARAGVLVGSGITLSKDGDIFATGVSTSTKVHVGVDTGVYGEDLVVTGNSRVTGITTFGDSDNSSSMLNIDATSGIPAISIPDSIIHSGDTNTKIRFPAADTVSVETGGSERARFDSNGRLLIGTTTEGFATYGDKFTIADSGHCGMTIRSGTSNYGTIYFSDGDDGSADEVRGFLDYNHSTNQLQLGTDSATTLRINSSGYVTKPKNLCLSYTASTSLNYTSAGTLIYATEVFDVGDSNAYNTSTGVFTAPVTGIYNIYHEYYNVTGNNAMTKLEKSTNSGSSFSQIKIFGRQRNDNAYTSAGFSHLVQANANDQFKITWYDGQVHINGTFTHFQVQLVQ